MKARSLPRAIPRFLVWALPILALLLTGCFTVNNHYYTTPGTAATTGSGQNAAYHADCDCHDGRPAAGKTPPFYLTISPCPERRTSYPSHHGGCFGGYSTYNPYGYGYPWYSPYAPPYRAGTPRRDDVSENPPAIGGVPARERRPSGGKVPRVSDNDVDVPSGGDIRIGGPVGRDDRPLSDNDIDAPSDGDARIGRPVGGDLRRVPGNDIDAPPAGDPISGDSVRRERPRRNEHDIDAPPAGTPREARPVGERIRRTDRDDANAPSTGPVRAQTPSPSPTSTDVPPTAEGAPRRNEPDRSTATQSRDTRPRSGRSTHASTESTPRAASSGSRSVERNDEAHEVRQETSASTATPRSVEAPPTKEAEATSAAATAAPATQVSAAPPR